MPFTYVATTEKGAVKRGSSDLASRASVIDWLQRRGLTVISVQEKRRAALWERFEATILSRVSRTERLLFTKHLAVMIKAGMTLIDALRILEEQAGSASLKRICHRLVEGVERGRTISECLAAYPRVFTAFYVNIIRSGEMSGNLERNLDHLATQLSKDRDLDKRVQTAMMYPSVVLVAALLIGFFFSVFVLPQVAALFSGLQGIELPLVTRIMMRIANFTRQHTLSTFLGMLGIIFGTWYVVRLPILAPITHRIVLRLPIAGKIIKDINLSRFAMVLGTSLRSGLDITKSIELASTVLGNLYYRRALERTLYSVQRGTPLSETLVAESRIFPRVTARMIEVGERTGRLDDVLGYLAEFYELEVETAMRNLSTILEPVLLLFIGAIAMVMAYAILIPIYNFIAAIRKI